MRLGFVGPCRGDLAALRAACELLLFELGAARVVYLGNDDGLDRALKGWREALGAPRDEEAFFDEAMRVVPRGSCDQIDALLAVDRRASRLRDIAVIPPPPNRAVEMIEDRVVLMVYDKSVLDEDDVANATAIVWGHANEPMLKPIGPRVFVTPGALHAGPGLRSVVLDVTPEGVHCRVVDGGGAAVHEHKLTLGRGARMGVQ